VRRADKRRPEIDPEAVTHRTLSRRGAASVGSVQTLAMDEVSSAPEGDAGHEDAPTTRSWIVADPNSGGMRSPLREGALTILEFHSRASRTSYRGGSALASQYKGCRSNP
jgi:hypothetical protein